MVAPAVLLAGAGAASLGSRLLGVRGERKRRRRLQERLLATLRPLEALSATQQFGPSETEGNLMQSATEGTLSDLAQQGILRSSYTASSVARAVASIEERRQARRNALLERIGAAKQAIYSDTELPGYGDAFAGTLGDIGQGLALYAGYKAGGGGLEELMTSANPQFPGEPVLGGAGIESYLEQEPSRRLRPRPARY